MIGPFGMVVGVMGLFKEMVVETAQTFAGNGAVASGTEHAQKNREQMQYRRTVRGRYLRKGDFAGGDPDRQQQANEYNRELNSEAKATNRATRKTRRS